ncbi:hypothetical protein [Vibrio algarum]|uniref:Uncharacterized protein n=1 Tax=Vibrio algarum TaxID=3020714 RepID=A0ABT4YTV4_9VIBR|nr:hypothetical protein [Vibrio sp. KJ40-1]MDB1125002.1 hypothetical protein [Vibrio sp. KJ40-1]
MTITPIDVDEIIDRTLKIASDIECELYQCARHSSKFTVIEGLRQWLKLGNKAGPFKGACTIDDGQNGNRNIREFCYEVFKSIDCEDDQLAKNCLSMVDFIGNESRYAIRFNTDDDREYEIDDYYEDDDGFISRHLNKNGDVIVPFQTVLITFWRAEQIHTTVGYHTFFHALREYFNDNDRPDLSQAISHQFGLTDRSEYACDQLSVIPSVLNEITTELLFANRPKWRDYYASSQEIIALINDRFNTPK